MNKTTHDLIRQLNDLLEAAALLSKRKDQSSPKLFEFVSSQAEQTIKDLIVLERI